MAGTAAQLPDLRTLNHRLRVALGDAEALVLDRRPNAYVATFPAEIVTCRLADKQVVRLFCKHESGASDGSHGHRLGVAYEAEVYRQLLARAGVSTPRFYGGGPTEQGTTPSLSSSTWTTPFGSTRPGTRRLSLLRTAVWIAKFQLLVTQRRLELPRSLARRHGHDYYLGWSQRAADSVAVPDPMTLSWSRSRRGSNAHSTS